MAKYDIGREFEEFLDARMLDMGITILAREPETELPDGKTPDFLVEHNGLRCYVEALALDSDLGNTDAEDDLVASLNIHKSTDFFLFLSTSHRQRLHTRLPRTSVKPIIEWMNSQSVDEIPEAPGNGRDVLPTKVFDLRGYPLEVTLLPVSKKHRTVEEAQERDLVGVQMLGGVSLHGVGDTTRERIREKYRRYTPDNLGGVPLVVAINDFGFRDMASDLYGTPVTNVHFDKNTFETVGTTESIKHDGVWCRVEKGELVRRAGHLLAVWYFRFAHANNPNPKECFYTNPFEDVQSKLPAPFFHGRHTRFPDGRLTYQDGRTN